MLAKFLSIEFSETEINFYLYHAHQRANKVGVMLTVEKYMYSHPLGPVSNELS